MELCLVIAPLFRALFAALLFAVAAAAALLRVGAARAAAAAGGTTALAALFAPKRNSRDSRHKERGGNYHYYLYCGHDFSFFCDRPAHEARDDRG